MLVLRDQVAFTEEDDHHNMRMYVIGTFTYKTYVTLSHRRCLATSKHSDPKEESRKDIRRRIFRHLYGDIEDALMGKGTNEEKLMMIHDVLERIKRET